MICYSFPTLFNVNKLSRFVEKRGKDTKKDETMNKCLGLLRLNMNSFYITIRYGEKVLIKNAYREKIGPDQSDHFYITALTSNTKVVVPE